MVQSVLQFLQFFKRSIELCLCVLGAQRRFPSSASANRESIVSQSASSRTIRQWRGGKNSSQTCSVQLSNCLFFLCSFVLQQFYVTVTGMPKSERTTTASDTCLAQELVSLKICSLVLRFVSNNSSSLSRLPALFFFSLIWCLPFTCWSMTKANQSHSASNCNTSNSLHNRNHQNCWEKACWTNLQLQQQLQQLRKRKMILCSHSNMLNLWNYCDQTSQHCSARDLFALKIPFQFAFLFLLFLCRDGVAQISAYAEAAVKPQTFALSFSLPNLQFELKSRNEFLGLANVIAFSKSIGFHTFCSCAGDCCDIAERWKTGFDCTCLFGFHFIWSFPCHFDFLISLSFFRSINA